MFRWLDFILIAFSSYGRRVLVEIYILQRFKEITQQPKETTFVKEFFFVRGNIFLFLGREF